MTLKLYLKVWVIIASCQDLIWVMIGKNVFCPGPFMHPHLQHIHCWFQHKADSDETCHASHHSLIITPTSINSCQIRMDDPQEHKSCKHQISRKEVITSPFNVTISAATPLHCLAMTLLSNSQNLQKVGNYIVIFYGNVLGHVWHTWCKKGTSGKKRSWSLHTCHMQIFKSIDFRTMGLWKWMTFFIRTVALY